MEFELFELTKKEADVIFEVFPIIMRKTWVEVNTSFRTWLIEKYPFMRMGAIMKLSSLYLIAHRREETPNEEWTKVFINNDIKTHHPWSVVEWTINNTKGFWACNVPRLVGENFSEYYYFENPNDAMMFKLRWA